MLDDHNSFQTESETIYSLLSPIGEGGMSVVLLAGVNSASILDRLFRSPRGTCPSQMTLGKLAYGRLFRSGELLDEIILARVNVGALPAFEINCHGGAIASRRVLDALKSEGARRVNWAELLVRRQHLGLLDRICREAAERIPKAPTLLAAKILLDQYEGGLSQAIRQLLSSVEQNSNWHIWESSVRKLLDTARFGRGLIEPLRIVLAGKPNVGKSTLANALLHFDRAIVHHLPGTTRDIIEETFSIEGIPFVLIDTAGLRTACHEIELDGVERGWRELHQADIAILVFDGSQPIDEEDRLLLAGPLPQNTITVINKCDLPQAIMATELSGIAEHEPTVISAQQELNIDALEVRILEIAYTSRPMPGEPVVFTDRQERLLRETLSAVARKDREAFVRLLNHVWADED